MSAYRLLNEAQLEILAFQRALKECVLSVDDAYGKSFEEFYVGFEGRFAEFSDVTLEMVNIQFFSILQLWSKAFDTTYPLCQVPWQPCLH